MPKILVDADACPVKDEVLRVAERHGLDVFLVSNGGIRPSRDPRVRIVVVPEGPDAADDWIADAARAADLVVTNDIPLAARCLEAGARVLRPTGELFTTSSIGAALATRDLMASLRETGQITGGPASFTPRDRSRFLDALETAVRASLREEAAR